MSHGIKYQAELVKGLEACCDADHAGDLATQSTTRVICHFAEGLSLGSVKNKHLFRLQPQRLKLQLQLDFLKKMFV